MPENTAGQNIDHLKQTQQGYFQFLDRKQLIAGNYFELGKVFYNGKKVIDDIFADHVVYEWKLDKAHISSTIDPQPSSLVDCPKWIQN